MGGNLEEDMLYVIVGKVFFFFFFSKICVGDVDGDTATTEAVPDPVGKGHKEKRLRP